MGVDFLRLGWGVWIFAPGEGNPPPFPLPLPMCDTWAQGHCDCMTAKDGMTALTAYRGIHAGVTKSGVKSK